MHKANQVFNKLAEQSLKRKKKEHGLQTPATIAAGGWATAASSSSFRAANKPKVLITYGYQSGRGGSHKALAQNAEKILHGMGIKNTELINAMRPADIVKFVKNRKTYAYKVDAGWGIASLFSSKNKTNLKTDLQMNNFVLGDSNTIERYAPGELAKKYNIPAHKKIITISAGESGSVIDLKTEKLLKALKGRQDTHVIALAANAKNTIKQNLKKMPVTVEGFLPKNEFNKVLASSDLNIGSGNPQTVLDQLKFKNKNMNVFTPGYLTEANSLVASKKYGIPAIDFRSEGFGSLVNNLLDSPQKSDNISSAGTKLYQREAKEFAEGLKSNIVKSFEGFKSKSRLRGAGFALLGGGLLYKGIRDVTAKT